VVTLIALDKEHYQDSEFDIMLKKIKEENQEDFEEPSEKEQEFNRVRELRPEELEGTYSAKSTDESSFGRSYNSEYRFTNFYYCAID
jgi:hypothetical protein